MNIREEWIGSNKTAKLEHLSELHEDISFDLGEIDKRLVSVEKVVKSTRQTVRDMLEILKGIDRRTKDWGNIPEEVTKLKNEVFRLKLRGR